jgi:hypothetical protein
VTGVVSCYLGLAYSLYLIAHNVELQARMVRRLLDPTQFQGAYYELIVANILIRAGFELFSLSWALWHCRCHAKSRSDPIPPVVNPCCNSIPVGHARRSFYDETQITRPCFVPRYYRLGRTIDR